MSFLLDEMGLDETGLDEMGWHKYKSGIALFPDHATNYT